MKNEKNTPEVEETVEETPEVVEEPKETGKVIKAPIKVKPVKAVKQKGDRGKDVDGLLAKLGLDKLETMHWVLIGVGLVVLLTIISVIGRNNERKKLEKRAERLRNSPGTLRANIRGKGKGDKSPGSILNTGDFSSHMSQSLLLRR